jgi:uncharacterized protein (DUF488 family)
MRDAKGNIFSIGHSTLAYEQFLKLLRGSGVTAVADVRTSPYSRHFPQFNIDELRRELKQDGVAYVFLGKELGGRPSDSTFYCDGVADYEKMSTTSDFKSGIDRVVSGAEKYDIALMCSEKHPLDCHRCLLVSRELVRLGFDTQHIISDGSLISQTKVEVELLEQAGRECDDFFAPRSERLSIAYRRRAKKIAFAQPEQGGKDPIAAE